MFDVGFSELILIAVVALVVIGPERLPKVARTAGALIGRMQRYVANVKSEVEREMQFEDLKKLQQEIQAQSEQVQNSILAPSQTTILPEAPLAQIEREPETQKQAKAPASKPKRVSTSNSVKTTKLVKDPESK
jgi:sec-independent protein translocase protein TatB